MTSPPTPGASGPEHEGRPARRLFIPFVFAAVLVAAMIAIVFAVVQPWEDDEVFQRSAPPSVTVTP